MFRKLVLSLAAIGALGAGALTMTPAPAAAQGFGFYFDTGERGYYGHRPRYRDYGRRYHRGYRHHRRHADRVCEVRRVRTIRPNGRVVVRRIRDCYRVPRYRW